ncbi:hypothetical protein Hanom_Chr04g00340811 [Helianthus anomalus]
MTWRGQRIEGSQLGCHPRPTPGLKPKPQGPRPNPSPPGVVAWAFSPNSRPIPHSLSIKLNTSLVQDDSSSSQRSYGINN